MKQEEEYTIGEKMNRVLIASVISFIIGTLISMFIMWFSGETRHGSRVFIHGIMFMCFILSFVFGRQCKPGILWKIADEGERITKMGNESYIESELKIKGVDYTPDYTWKTVPWTPILKCVFWNYLVFFIFGAFALFIWFCYWCPEGITGTVNYCSEDLDMFGLLGMNIGYTLGLGSIYNAMNS